MLWLLFAVVCLGPAWVMIRRYRKERGELGPSTFEQPSTHHQVVYIDGRYLGPFLAVVGIWALVQFVAGLVN